MLKNLMKGVTPEFAEARSREFIKLQAERRFLEKVEEICGGSKGLGLDPGRIQKMVDADLRLATLLKEIGYEIPPITIVTRPFINYLKTLNNDQMMDLMERVVPEQVAILRQHPAFAIRMTEDLKTMAGA